MINKDISLFNYSPVSITPAPTPTFTSTPSISPVTVIPVESVNNSESVPVIPTAAPAPILTEEGILSILGNANSSNALNETYTNVAYQDVQKLLTSLPTIVTNQHNVPLNFSLDSKDFSLFTGEQNQHDLEIKVIKQPTTDLKPKDNKKNLERSIIDGDIEGAFAGPNKTYPITSISDVKKIMKESKTNNSASFKRILSRAINIAERYGWMQEELTDGVEVQNLTGTNKILHLSDDIKLDTTTEVNNSISVMNDSVPDFQAFEDQETHKMMLKIPAGRLGKWVHDDYGVIEFTQEKFDQAIDNFNAGVVGYEPTLNVGHFMDVQAVGAAPTEGIACEVYQEGDVLYADYECFNPVVFNDVLNKRYRRSSSELVMDYVDRTNGRCVGMTLVGMALTNRPFITDMPTVTVLTDKHSIDNKPITFAQFNLYGNDNTKEDAMILNDKITLDTTDLNNAENMQTEPLNDSTVIIAQPPAATDNSTELKSLSTEIAQLKLAFETAMKAQELQFNNQLAEYGKEREGLLNTNSALEARIASMEAEKEATLLSEKVETIKGLNLTEEQKAQYVQMFTDKTLGSPENEKTVLSTLVKTFGSTTSFNKFTQQLGDSTSVVNLSAADSINPYTSLIERNKASVK